ncbi:L-serine ammonia-lyase [Methylobacterium soli]|uniref:L-serine dehydratase n=1 Tax=Methylobacterium soli TaxID=553447 RepID=A0A6L3T016_9HYPH|nr:L-serine ammonia-lyase [Methylobacterium soli]KAB1078036.1 L-serine ammonia-lyase [Methylobacterium soli]GJE41668.1 L-serine dehydratase [Methylobacterium soli]
MISAFDLFKIGIGPSSSHTVGPMVAAARFRAGLGPATRRVRAEIFGSLAWTGRGHGTDIAIFLGLLGEDPATVDPDAVAGLVSGLAAARRIAIPGSPAGAAFDPGSDLVFNLTEILPRHTNGMRFRAYDAAGTCLSEQDFYSIGGGFVVGAQEGTEGLLAEAALPFASGAELLDLCARTGLSVPQVQFANELTQRERGAIEAGLDAIRDAMFACIERGLRQEGELPGGLKVRRRARRLHEALEGSRLANDRPAHEIMDWISLFALAVNEENASGGRVVTAPTNGAAGIVPAVLRYTRDFCPGWSDARGRDFLLSAAAIGGLIKRRASISGAEVGCQGEVGSAAAMAAAGLAAALGGSAYQVENAAEIAMEHHLGMTCDPIGGLVQIPCIERNAFGANKAIVAASLALRGDGQHRVSLDEVIETMRQTGADMQSKYKETALGGLAVNVAAC